MKKINAPVILGLFSGIVSNINLIVLNVKNDYRQILGLYIPNYSDIAYFISTFMQFLLKISFHLDLSNFKESLRMFGIG